MNPTKLKVTLIQDHRHAGKAYKAGAVIEVTEAEAIWLEKHGVITPLNSADSSPKAAAKAATTTAAEK